MTHIADILNPDEFIAAARDNLIRVQTHPEFPELSIANYTEHAAFSRTWNHVTRTCRGFIWNNETGEVLARPFPKFFNFDEPESPRILDDQVVWHWADKADGSLGILYERPDGEHALATRGSFASEQAKLGTSILQRAESQGGVKFTDFCEWIDMFEQGYTPLFEICGPSNRIVLRYAEDFLQPLGYIHMGTGEFVPPAGAQRRTMASLLGDLSRSNAEGWVVWLSNTKPVKIKQADYIELHRMVSNLTEKEVWRQLRAGTYATYVKELPDELFQLAEGWADGLRESFTIIFQQALLVLESLTRADHDTRKEQAMWIQRNVLAEHRGLVFGLLDGKDITDSIWRMLEPSGATNHTNGSQ
jgi:RNA ligase